MIGLSSVPVDVVGLRMLVLCKFRITIETMESKRVLVASSCPGISL
jgi:hypothetical protein